MTLKMTLKVWTITACRGEEIDHAVLGEIYTCRYEAFRVLKQLAEANENYKFDIMEHNLEVDA